MNGTVQRNNNELWVTISARGQHRPGITLCNTDCLFGLSAGQPRDSLGQSKALYLRALHHVKCLVWHDDACITHLLLVAVLDSIFRGSALLPDFLG
jgi:hypothetical protein